MPQVSIYNQDGKVTGDMQLSDAHFGVTVNQAVVHEALLTQQANRRHAVANTKTRGEVRGGGKKPWKQKGTGRARQGSIRSPQWVGGGVVFGPTSERNFARKINKKTKQKALFMALSDKVAHERLVVLESFAPAQPKTKFMATLVTKLPVVRTALYILPSSNPSVVRMARNLKNVHVVTAQSVNLEDVLRAGTVVFEKEAVSAFEKTFNVKTA
jgi:large subunit ribosomal protein L4